TSLRVSESKRVQPLLQIAIDAFPMLTTILGAQDRAAGTDRDPVIRIEKLHVFEPVEYVCLLELPAHTLVFRVPDRAARTHNPSFGWRNKRHAKKIFSRRTRNRIPRHATVNGVENRAF